eukprot:PhM_4_TR14127/c1_g1_i4/m.90891/K05795/terD; tellurium resistance protein TerD
MVSIHCYNEGTFADCCSITTRLTDLTENRIVDKHDADYTAAQSSLLLYVVQRRDATYWDVAACSVSLPGHTFMDGYGAMLHHVRPDLAGGRVAEGRFNLRKNDEYTIPATVKRLRFGLGWDTRCDLDASVHVHKRNACLKEIVFHGQTESCCGTIRHSGDCRDGDGDGENEQIVIRLEKVPADVFCLVVSVHVYDDDVTFKDVDGAFCRLVDVSDKKLERELFQFQILEKGSANGILFCSVYRDYTKPPGWWKAQAIGQWVSGDMRRVGYHSIAYTTRLPGLVTLHQFTRDIAADPDNYQNEYGSSEEGDDGDDKSTRKLKSDAHNHSQQAVVRTSQKRCCVVS